MEEIPFTIQSVFCNEKGSIFSYCGEWILAVLLLEHKYRMMTKPTVILSKVLSLSVFSGKENGNDE